MKLVIAGGGGFRVPLIYRALASGRFAGLVDRLVLHDTDAARLRGIGRVLESMPLPGGAKPPQLGTTESLATALPGADAVFAAIRTGGAQGRVLDERVALRHGVLGQETVGAGGISYALRSIPEMLGIARAMREHCPDAWLVNFTNPAGMVVQALQPVLGEKVVGICDSASGLARRAASAAGVPLTEGSLAGVDYVGLNHLGWLRALVYDGADRLPALLADPDRLASFEEGRVFGTDLLRLLSAIPNEYLFYYYFRREALQAVAGSAQTRGEVLMEQQADLYPQLLEAADPYAVWEHARRAREEGYLAEARHLEEQRDEEDLAGGGYERVALAVLQGLLGGAETELIVNVRNGGTLPQLGADDVVEIPARVSAAGVRPLPAGPLSAHQLGLMSQVKAVEHEVVAASLHGSRDSALRAFALHPLIDSAHLGQRLLSGYEAAFPALRSGWR
jgi:6-phospho-beta-glucosidase